MCSRAGEASARARPSGTPAADSGLVLSFSDFHRCSHHFWASQARMAGLQSFAESCTSQQKDLEAHCVPL